MTRYRRAGHLIGVTWYAVAVLVLIKTGVGVFTAWRTGLPLDGGSTTLCLFGLILFALKCVEWSLENLEQLLKR